MAALLPVAIGGFSVLGAFAVLRAINSALPLSPFALNLVIGLGLGLAIDYSLFCVSRFREELGRGADVPSAVRGTMQTAGRTVLFSAITVAAAMACLTVFPQRFLVSMGLGGLVVALVAGASTVVFLPALLMLMGRRLGKVTPGPEESGRWYRLAPSRDATPRHGRSADRGRAPAPRRTRAWDPLERNRRLRAADRPERTHSLGRDRAGLPRRRLHPRDTRGQRPHRRRPGDPHLRRRAAADRPASYHVSAPRDLGRDTWEIDVDARGTPITQQSQSVVNAIRAQPAPYPVAVGGATADLIDQHTATSRTLPIAIALLDRAHDQAFCG